MNWIWERLGSWTRRAAAAALTADGRPVPRHIAFIMDGNRRYAEARALRKVEGHAFGYARLLDALEWCLQLGVACVSVYAFSIDNYRRSGEEVATLMALAEDKLAHLLQECAMLERHGVQVRVVGDLSLAPAAVQAAAARIEAATAHHDRAVLNLCFSYTASEELQRALDSLAAQHAADNSSSGAPSSGSGPSLLTAAALDGALYTRGCPPVDLLVRTSGETRLSDFLLWQCRHALLVFTQVLWPEFGFLDLVAAVQQYQRQHAHLQRLQAAAEAQAAAAAAAEVHGRAPAAVAVAVRQAPGAAAAGAAGQRTCAWQQLPADKLADADGRQGLQQGLQRCSPCSIASPASPSSPSSRSEGSAESASLAAAAATEAAHAEALQPRRRRAAARQ